MKGGTTVIAFARDPTGYMWEIIERKGKDIPEPIAQACSMLPRLSMHSLLLKCLNRGLYVRIASGGQECSHLYALIGVRFCAGDAAGDRPGREHKVMS